MPLWLFLKEAFSKCCSCSQQSYTDLFYFVLFSFVKEESLVWFSFFFFGSHCRFNFPLSNRLLVKKKKKKNSPSSHSLKRLRVLKGKTFSSDKKSPWGSGKGALHLVSERYNRSLSSTIWLPGKIHSFYILRSTSHLLFSILFPFSWESLSPQNSGHKNRQPLVAIPPPKPLFFKLILYLLFRKYSKYILWNSITFLKGLFLKRVID